jgi:hypothetical protein
MSSTEAPGTGAAGGAATDPDAERYRSVVSDAVGHVLDRAPQLDLAG